MTERFGFEAIETLRLRLTLREAQSGATRARTRSFRRAALGFFASIAIALTLALTLTTPHYREPDPQVLGLRGAISD